MRRENNERKMTGVRKGEKGEGGGEKVSKDKWGKGRTAHDEIRSRRDVTLPIFI